MTNKSKSILLSDVKIKGNLTEKENISIDCEIEGNVYADNVEVNERANIKGNIKSTSAIVSGKVRGDINADKVHVSSSADVDGTISQKTLSIAEGATLKIKTETKK